MLHMVLTVLQVFSSIAIIALVLLQRGKGADAGAGFGAGASGTVFGARGATTKIIRPPWRSIFRRAPAASAS